MLTKAQNKAARLCAEGWLSYPEIAVRCNIARKTLWQWRDLPDFKERVADLRQTYADKIKSNGVADLLNRVRASNIRWRKMMRLANQIKNLEDFDPSLMKELREHESHVAQQLGQLQKNDADSSDKLFGPAKTVASVEIPSGAIPALPRPETVQDSEGGATIGQDGERETQAGDESVGALPGESGTSSGSMG